MPCVDYEPDKSSSIFSERAFSIMRLQNKMKMVIILIRAKQSHIDDVIFVANLILHRMVLISMVMNAYTPNTDCLQSFIFFFHEIVCLATLYQRHTTIICTVYRTKSENITLWWLIFVVIFEAEQPFRRRQHQSCALHSKTQRCIIISCGNTVAMIAEGDVLD